MRLDTHTMKVCADVYEPNSLLSALERELQKMGITLVRKDLRNAGGDYVIKTRREEYWIERKTITDLFSSLTRNVYEHGKPKPAGRERRLFSQLLKLKGEGRVPILLVEGPFPEDVRARHTLAGVEVWCVRNGIFVIHTANMEDSAYTVAQIAKKEMEGTGTH